MEDHLFGEQMWRRPKSGSGYTLKGSDDFTHIVPKNGIEWEAYNPLEDDDILPALLNDIPTDPDSSSFQPVASDWINQYGLLGLLPLKLRRVSFWPRWGGGQSRDKQPITQASYDVSRTGNTYSPTQGINYWPPEENVEQFNPEEGEPLSPEALEYLLKDNVWRSGGFQTPGVMALNRLWERVVPWSISMGYASYFPNKPDILDFMGRVQNEEGPSPLGKTSRDSFHEHLEQQEYPIPPSENDAPEMFFNQYGERLEDFRRAVDRLQRWADFLEDSSLEDTETQSRINKILSGFSFEIVSSEKEWIPQVNARSLYGILLFRLVQEHLLNGQTLKRCPMCSTFHYRDSHFCEKNTHNHNNARVRRHTLKGQAKNKLEYIKQYLNSEEEQKASKAREELSDLYEKHDRLRTPQSDSIEHLCEEADKLLEDEGLPFSTKERDL